MRVWRFFPASIGRSRGRVDSGSLRGGYPTANPDAGIVAFLTDYSSWLNRVALWFSKIERGVIGRGVFTSVPDLKRKLMSYIDLRGAREAGR